jgi:hypothetical protein
LAEHLVEGKPIETVKLAVLGANGAPSYILR